MFIDWTQNHPWKSTIAPYSLRGFDYPTVAAPVTWDEDERESGTGDLRPLLFLASDMPARLDSYGDLMAGGATLRQSLPAGL